MLQLIPIFIMILLQNPCNGPVCLLQNRETMNLEEWSFQKGKINYVEKLSFSDNA